MRKLHAWTTPSRERGYSRSWGNLRLLRAAVADLDKALQTGRCALPIPAFAARITQAVGLSTCDLRFYPPAGQLPLGVAFVKG